MLGPQIEEEEKFNSFPKINKASFHVSEFLQVF